MKSMCERERDVKSTGKKKPARCIWHQHAINARSCSRTSHVHGVIGSGSCHPFTPIANRAEDYCPSQHPDWPMIFGDKHSLVSLIDIEDPDFWMTENVEGASHQLKNGVASAIEQLVDQVGDLQLPGKKGPRFWNAVRTLDQADHMKSKRRRRTFPNNRCGIARRMYKPPGGEPLISRPFLL